MAIGRVGDGGGPREWLESLPPVTRAWFLASLLTTCLISFGILPAQRVVWYWPLVWNKFELWRLVTPFAFLGGFSFPFLINIYLLVQYSKNYEVSPYDTGAGGSTADYAWMLAIGMALLLVMSTFMGIPTPSQGLTYMVLYVWSRRNSTAQVSVYGIRMAAVYLPFALLALNMVIGNSLVMPIMGIVTGHTYYFCVDPFPAQYGTELVKTPALVADLFSGAGRPSAPASNTSRGFTATAPPGRPAAQGRYAGGGAPAAGAAYQRRGYNWGSGRTLGTE